MTPAGCIEPHWAPTCQTLLMFRAPQCQTFLAFREPQRTSAGTQKGFPSPTLIPPDNCVWSICITADIEGGRGGNRPLKLWARGRKKGSKHRAVQSPEKKKKQKTKKALGAPKYFGMGTYHIADAGRSTVHSAECGLRDGERVGRSQAASASDPDRRPPTSPVCICFKQLCCKSQNLMNLQTDSCSITQSLLQAVP